ncbi:MAG: DUF1302 family protein [Vicinamibacterales bacterium]
MSLVFASDLCAQSTSLTGNVSALVDVLPNVPRAETVTELRIRALADLQIEPKSWLRFRFAGLADGLVADRGGTVRDATADALEAWIEVSSARGDLRAGVGRIAWGRLDEVQPTDVVNPIDVARFLLDGRSEARLPVAFLRARLIPSDRLIVEGIVVPFFRAGAFDRLDEATSPFNLLRDLPPPACPPGVPCPAAWSVLRATPANGDLQGGARLAATSGRVDWSISAWRGFVPFALIGGIAPGQPGSLRLVHPRYTMLGADLETVTGKWAWRAEAAWFPDRPLQVENEPRTFEAGSFEGGVGLDRRAGDFTLSGTLLFRRTGAGDPADREAALNDVSVVAGFSRTYDRDRIETRVFALINPEDKAGFLRGVLAWKPIDDVAIETSIGWFAGEGDDQTGTGLALQDLSPLRDRDFGYIRLKYYFGR